MNIMTCNLDKSERLPTLPSSNPIKTVTDYNTTLEDPLSCNLIEVDEAFGYFKSLNLSHDSNLDVAANARTRWRSNFVNWIRTTQKLNENLKTDCDLIYSVAQCSFNWDDSVHWRMIQTIYRKLTGTCTDCLKFGPHWQLIGFQGSDPSTDLRGVGIFGLVQMLYLTTNEPAFPLAQKLFIVSNSETQPFPLAVLSLNVTQISLNALRSGRLNRECNNRQTVLQVLNIYYVALLNYICNIWITEHKTIKDSGYLLKDAEKCCSKNVKKLFLELPSQLEQHKLQ